MKNKSILFLIILCSSVTVVNAKDFYSHKIVSCSAGGNHSLAIDESGNLWAWGGNAAGQLGNGTTIEKTTPILVKDGTKFKTVSAGLAHSLAIDEYGNLYAWGDNSFGQLGVSNSTDNSEPQQIMIGRKFKIVSGGYYHSLAIDELGNLWVWGSNSEGQLGDGTQQDKYTPIQIMNGTKFKLVSVGVYHSLAIDESGNLWAWGNNGYNQLGDGTFLSKLSPIQVKSGTKFKTVSASNVYSLAIDESGNLWGWGYVQFLSYKFIDKIETAMPGTKFTDVSAGGNHSLAIDEAGQLWAWGVNENGQLGDGTTLGKFETPIKILSGKKFNAIAAGYGHSLVIDNSNNLWVWGKNTNGQLGDGSDWDESKPTQVMAGIKIKASAASSYTAYAIDGAGNLWLMGIDHDTTYSIPKQKFFETGIKFDTISAGAGHYLTIDKYGGLWAWGNNSYGELGDGTTKDKFTPVQVMSGTKFKIVSAANVCSYAIDELGNLWAWGRNENENLGDGTKINKSTPVHIGLGTKFKIVSTASSTTLAIDEFGNLWAWGGYGYGWKGEVSTYPRSSIPLKIIPGMKFKNISCGTSRFAIDELGNLWAWGENADGQLGDGTTKDSYSSVNIMLGTKFKMISTSDVSFNHSLAIDESGYLWAWGDNYFGELGDGTIVNKYSPIKIKPDTKFKSIYSGNVYSMAIDVAENLYVWGRNEYGQLGNGTAAWREFPLLLNNKNFPDAIIGLHVNVDIKAYGINSQIKVQSKESERYNVYDLQGCKVASGKLKSGETSIPINSGFYIFCTEKYKIKVFVK